MCVPVDAELPDIGLPFPLPSGERVTLTSADGSTFAAHRADAPEPTGTGIVVLPDVRGLFAFYERLAEAFAASGYDAVSIDYFGRTVGLDPRPDDWEYMPYVEQTQPDQIRDDVAAAVDLLRRERNVSRVMTVGFCMGGAFSLRQGLAGHGLAGVVSFYGTANAWRGKLEPIYDRAGEFEGKVLGLYGGADKGIPVEDVERFDQALTDAGTDHDIHVYPGAPHSFFDRGYEDWAEECRDAWRRVMAFAAV
jgi:carboxymethylenebutenolidase